MWAAGVSPVFTEVHDKKQSKTELGAQLVQRAASAPLTILVGCSHAVQNENKLIMVPSFTLGRFRCGQEMDADISVQQQGFGVVQPAITGSSCDSFFSG